MTQSSQDDCQDSCPCRERHAAIPEVIRLIVAMQELVSRYSDETLKAEKLLSELSFLLAINENELRHGRPPVLDKAQLSSVAKRTP